MIKTKKTAIIAAMAAFWGIIGVVVATSGPLQFSYSFSTGTTQAPQSQAISIARAELAAADATGYRQVKPLAANVIAPNTPFVIYIEPINLTSTFENGVIKGSMTVDIEVRNSAGAVVGNQKAAWKLPVSVAATSQRPLTQVFANLNLTHLTFAPGHYQLVVRVHDDLSGQVAERAIDVELREPAAAAPGSQPAPAQPPRR